MSRFLILLLLSALSLQNLLGVDYITHDTTWYGNITLHDSTIVNPGITLTIRRGTIVTIPSGDILKCDQGVLNIEEDCTFIGSYTDSYIFAGGRLYLGDNFLFSGTDSNSFWRGLIISTCDVPDNVNRGYFRNCNLSIAGSDFRMDRVDFRNSLIKVVDSETDIYSCNFYNSHLSFADLRTPLDTKLKLYSSFFTGENNFSDAQLKLNSIYQFIVKDNEFTRGFDAIDIEDTNVSRVNCVAKNRVHDNISIGLKISNSAMMIIDGNQIYNNNYGILGLGNSSIKLEGSQREPYQKIYNNRRWQVAADCESIPSPFRYNLITNFGGENLVTCFNHNGNNLPHNIEYNFWGPNLDFRVAFEPYRAFDWDPQWFPLIESDSASSNQENDFRVYNSPNPFNPETNISFTLEIDSQVKLTIFNVNGEVVKSYGSEFLNRGSHSFKFNGSELNSGVYFYQLDLNGKSYTNKMILTK
jgi:hypothetical protein